MLCRSGAITRRLFIAPRHLNTSFKMPPYSVPLVPFSTESTNGKLVELKTPLDFDRFVHCPSLVLVDFSAIWCGPCRMLTPILSDLAARNTTIRFGKVDVDDTPAIASRFKISSVPKVILFKDGKEIDSFMGAQPASAIQTFLNKHLK